MKIRTPSFKGMSPRTGDKYLDPSQAALAKDCRVYNGELRPLRDALYTWTPTKLGTIETIHLFARTYWFHWAADVDVVRTLVPNDTTERTFWTGDGYPKQTEAGMATSGGTTDYPTNHYALGIPAPASAPTLSAPAPSDATENETRFYVYTYVSAWGEEGPPSPLSYELVCDVDATVDISSMSTAPTGPYNITSKRIYRLGTGTSESDFFFVAEIPVANTTYSDSVAGSALREPLLTEEYDPPPDDLQGLIALTNGVVAGFKGKDVYFTPPNAPYAWPRSYMVATEHDVVGLGAYDTTLVILTEGFPYLATGQDPAAVALSQIEVAQACVSKRSIASLGAAGVVYATPDGLAAIGPGGFEMVSEPYMTKDEWRAYNPSSIVAAQHDGMYVGFYDTGTTQGGFMFSRDDGFIELDFHATAAYTDLLTDTLYLVVDGDIVAFDSAGTLRTYTWKSKRFQMPPVSLAAARVLADSYDDLTIKFYADGVLRHTQVVTGPDAFRLPAGDRARVWQFELSGTADVQEVTAATSVVELHS